MALRVQWTAEATEQLEVTWTASGKVDKVSRPDGSGKSELDFGYDATGQRTRKNVQDDAGALQSTQHYIRDAQGNIMAIYNFDLSSGPPAILTVSDRSLYGSSRVGVDAIKVNVTSYPAASSTTLTHALGAKQYELSDHLGNVHVTVSDHHIKIDPEEDDETNWFEAQVISAQDYYPFGMTLPGRNYQNGAYRFTFNGMEKDDEVKGQGNHIDFIARGYDPRTGRWLSKDPLARKYPALSPYSFALNSPILFLDPNGNEGVVSIQHNPDGGGTITISTIVYVTGAGATEAKAKAFQENYKKYVDAGTYDYEGEEYDIEINIEFRFESDKSKIELQRGENILEITEEPVNAGHAHGEGGIVKSYERNEETGEITEVKTEVQEWITGNSAVIGKNSTARTATHEVLHLLGLSDRYRMRPFVSRDSEGNKVMKKAKEAFKGFVGDIMANGDNFSQIHTDNYGKYILGQEGTQGGSFILDRYVDIDAETGDLLNGKQEEK